MKIDRIMKKLDIFTQSQDLLGRHPQNHIFWGGNLNFHPIWIKMVPKCSENNPLSYKNETSLILNIKFLLPTPIIKVVFIYKKKKRKKFICNV